MIHHVGVRPTELILVRRMSEAHRVIDIEDFVRLQPLGIAAEILEGLIRNEHGTLAHQREIILVVDVPVTPVVAAAEEHPRFVWSLMRAEDHADTRVYPASP